MSNAFERSFFQKPQELRLKRRDHLADLIQEHRSAVSHLEEAALLAIGPGERPALVAEQLALEQRLRKSRASDVHERLRRTAAVVVDHLCREVFARSALAREQDRRGRARRDLLQQRLDGVESRAIPDNPTERVGLGLARSQRFHFTAQARRFERFVDQQRNLVQIEGFVRVVVGSLLHRLHGGFHAGIRGEENDQRVGGPFLDSLEHRQTIAIGQPVVEQDEIDALLALGQRLGRSAGFDNVVAFGLQAVAERPANQLLVVDDEDRGSVHGSPDIVAQVADRQFECLRRRAGRAKLLRSSSQCASDERRQRLHLEWLVHDGTDPETPCFLHNLGGAEGRHQNHARRR
jgi:hypothetical protein